LQDCSTEKEGATFRPVWSVEQRWSEEANSWATFIIVETKDISIGVPVLFAHQTLPTYKELVRSIITRLTGYIRRIHAIRQKALETAQ